MDLTMNLLYSSKLEKLGVTGTYPKTDNCYHVRVTDDKGNSWESHYMPKPVYHMWEKLNVLRHNKTTIKKKDIADLVTIFNEYGDWKWEDADTNAAMDAAEADY
jgi:hypothetical protein